MSEREHRVEGRLLMEVRRMIVAVDHALMRDYLQHRMSREEFRQRRLDLGYALVAYEQLMEERDE
ncbi:MAG: hypothetical protein V3T22_10600 [Planctomycetota bacterium]